MNLIKHVALVSAVALAPAFALAQTTAPSTAPAATAPATQGTPAKGEHRKQRAERLKAADTNGDGAISKAEADAAGLKNVSKNFDKLDANKDGKITREEMRTARTEYHQAHKGMHGAAPAAPSAPAAPVAPPAAK